MTIEMMPPVAGPRLPVPSPPKPGLAVPGLAVPGLSVPGLSVPGLSVPGLPGPRPPVTRLAGRYLLLNRRGHGAFGTVWAAEDERLRRNVVVKQVPWPEPGRSGRPRLGHAEAEALARVNHHGVPKVYDLITDELNQVDWIVMEALAGHDLDRTLGDAGPMPPAELTGLAAGLLDVLDAVHAAGLVHRDVKPANVHVCGESRFALTDFGLATGQDVASGYLVGSLPYLAPEILTRNAYHPATDLYALGATLFAAVLGHTPPSTMDDVVSGAPPLPGLRRDLRGHPLRALILGLVQPDPGDRADVETALGLLPRR
jgi:serine/threonine protein kinase